MGFSRQEYWRGLLFPSREDLPDPGIKPKSLGSPHWQAGSLPLCHLGLPLWLKNLPAMWETWVQSLGWEDSLEEGMAIHSSILACRIPCTEEPGGLQSIGL